MNTKEITRDELKGREPICYGYKAVKYDGGTQQAFKYGNQGEQLVGRIFEYEGKIEVCKNGLHFCKQPADVFKFYEPLAYNRYFKIAAYEKVDDHHDGQKSAANIIEFVEEYDIMQYIDIMRTHKTQCDSHTDNASNAVNESYAVNESNAVNTSNAVNGSSAVNGSHAVNRSTAVNRSDGVNDSIAVSNSYGILKCEAISCGIFCYRKSGGKYLLFNKKVKEERFEEVYAKIKSFDWVPHFNNFYELKGDKACQILCFPLLKAVDNKTAWSTMPEEMLEYIKSLPEYNEKIFKKITE